ncbi:coproporphyrinogen III oxidase [Neolentinus lepideus HHB14362 ss-1]|uniref:coproporphyrinogen oxidase n=1 Tax=Neolentinus lepideus HHB14362 ss-1 TaxID=1314782 RepID=A0A165QSV8_9AGAM|nr:coproporphyrinogen III oxidase [Neolentinus lepideus HHB14362 ss-1]
MRQQVEEYITSLQEQIVSAFEALDPKAPAFKRDSWTRAQGGLGQSCVFSMPADDPSGHSSILEKAGVNISIVHGTLPPAAIKQMKADHSSLPYDPDAQTTLPFFAAGLSIVIHPRNPHAPTTHANYRYFEVTAPDDPRAVLAWWFGGGGDLTPSYLYDADAAHFHGTLKAACDAHGAAYYPALKRWCDEYFYIPHRGEARGVGGLFFDDLCDAPHARIPGSGRTADGIFAFVRALGDAFVPSYLPILARRAHTPYTPQQRRWQLVRRGRYVEFNLVYDRGTKFGLMTPGARVESILMTLPENVRWEYMCDMGGEGTEEGRLVEVLTKPREWV